MNISKLHFATSLSALLMVVLVPTANAQRPGDGFVGFWKGTLTMDVVHDVPAEDLERLSKPVELEIRIFRQGPVELYFTFEEDEWEFTEQRGFRMTPIDQAGQNGVVPARLPGNIGWISSVALNLTVQSADTLLLSWSRLTIRDQLSNDGLDEFGFAGVAVLNRISDEE